MQAYLKSAITKSAVVGMMVGLIGGCASASEPSGNLSISQTISTAPHTHQHDDHQHDGHSHEIPRAVGTKADFDKWLTDNPWQVGQVAAYNGFLNRHLGKNATPPLHQLLTTARSWQECGFEPYQVPPDYLWDNMLPTLRLYAKLKQLGILPPHTEIRSVYRNPELNRCAGGAAASKHLTNGAIDIWVPTYDKDSWQMKDLQNRLCQFWIDNGSSHAFGLGIYATGAIHLDTQGYRKWGAEFSEYGSPCRYILPKPDGGYTNFSVTQTPITSTIAPNIPTTHAPIPPQVLPPATMPQATQTVPTNFAVPVAPTGEPINYWNPADLGLESPVLPIIKSNSGQ